LSVSCPYFRPVERLEDGAWLRPPRVPLGDPCKGLCEAIAPSVEPTLEELRSLCNNGYARGRCPRFPQNAEGDAVRFSVASDAPDEVQIVYVLERDYGPIDHGRLVYRPSGGFVEAPVNGLLLAQAGRFIESYLRRRSGF
jgi:hypothetical protein